MAKENKWVFLVVGAIIGIPLGAILYQIFMEKKAAVKVIYGANYSYTEDGKISQYMPVPLSTAGNT